MVLPIGWTELQLKVPPMVGRYVDLKGMFEVSGVIWFLETSTPLHVYYSTYRNNFIQIIQTHINSQQLTMSTNIINSFMTITMIGRDFDQKKKENIIRFIVHIQVVQSSPQCRWSAPWCTSVQ